MQINNAGALAPKQAAQPQAVEPKLVVPQLKAPLEADTFVRQEAPANDIRFSGCCG